MFSNAVVNEYMWSSVVTFVAAFGVAISPLAGGTTWTSAALLSLGAVGARAGARAVLNLVTTKFSTLSSRGAPVK